MKACYSTTMNEEESHSSTFRNSAAEYNGTKLGLALEFCLLRCIWMLMSSDGLIVLMMTAIALVSIFQTKDEFSGRKEKTVLLLLIFHSTQQVNAVLEILPPFIHLFT